MTHQLQRQAQGQTPLEIQLQELRKQLDAANRKTDRYVHLVGALYEELNNLRRSICHNCKNKFVPSYPPVPSVQLDRPRPSFWRRIGGSRQTKAPSGLPPISSPHAGESLDASIPVHSVTTLENQAKPSISSRPRALTTAGGSPNTHIPITLAQDQTTAVILGLRQASSSANPIMTVQPSTIPVDEIRSKQPKWRVSHNPKIKRALHIDLVKTFKSAANVYCVMFSPDGKYLAAGLDNESGRTYIYDVEKGLKICFFIDLYLKSHPTTWCIRFSPDNKRIATSSSDRQIRVWDIAQKRMITAFAGHRTSAGTICFSPNGRFLIAGDGGGSVYVWSLRDGSSKKLIEDAYTICSVTFSPDGQHIASVDAGGWLRIWEARTGQLLDRWRGHTWNVFLALFSPDGKGLMSVGEGTIMRYWDVSSLAGGRAQVMSGTPGQRFQHIRSFEGHNASIRSVSFSPDFRCVATSSLDEGVQIWNPRTAEWQCTLHGHNTYTRTVDFSPAGKYFACGGREVSLWRYT